MEAKLTKDFQTKPYRPTGGLHLCCTNIYSLLIDWKLTALSFFLHGLFVLKYAKSSNQRDFFSRFTCFSNMSNQNSRIRVTAKKPLQQEQTFFLQCSFLFHTSVSSLLNKESMYRLYGQTQCACCLCMHR